MFDEYFWGKQGTGIPTPPCLCELVDMELLPQVATMVLSHLPVEWLCHPLDSLTWLQSTQEAA